MKNKEKQAMAAYEAPQVEVIEVQVEQGFATSGNGGLPPYANEPWNN